MKVIHIGSYVIIFYDSTGILEREFFYENQMFYNLLSYSLFKLNYINCTYINSGGIDRIKFNSCDIYNICYRMSAGVSE